MADPLAEIKAAIDVPDFDRARTLLRDALKEPNAEVYFLASKVALDAQQKLEFLHKTVEADPFHVQAYYELKQLASTHTPFVQLQATITPEKQPDLAQQLAEEEENTIKYNNLIQVHERSFKQANSVAIIGLSMVGAGILLEGLVISSLSQDDAACFSVPLIVLAILGFLIAILGSYGRTKADVSLTQAQKNLAESKAKIVTIKANRAGE